MSSSLIVDLGALALLALGASNGWRVGAVRTLVGVSAVVLGVYLASVGRAPLTALIASALPAVDPLLIGAVVVVGGTWLIIWIGSLTLGTTIRALIRIVHLGAVDSLVGALLGIVQMIFLLGGLVFVSDALRSFGALSGGFAAVADAMSGSTTATLIRGELFPFVGALIGGWLPDALRALLSP